MDEAAHYEEFGHDDHLHVAEPRSRSFDFQVNPEAFKTMLAAVTPAVMYKAKTTTEDEGLEDDGSLEAWTARIRDPKAFSKGVRVRTSPKRLEDPIEYGVCVEDAFRDEDWKVQVRWDNPIKNTAGSDHNPWTSFNYGFSGGAMMLNRQGTDLRSLYPLETY